MELAKRMLPTSRTDDRPDGRPRWSPSASTSIRPLGSRDGRHSAQFSSSACLRAREPGASRPSTLGVPGADRRGQTGSSGPSQRPPPRRSQGRRVRHRRFLPLPRRSYDQQGRLSASTARVLRTAGPRHPWPDRPADCRAGRVHHRPDAGRRWTSTPGCDYAEELDKLGPGDWHVFSLRTVGRAGRSGSTATSRATTSPRCTGHDLQSRT